MRYVLRDSCACAVAPGVLSCVCVPGCHLVRMRCPRVDLSAALLIPGPWQDRVCVFAYAVRFGCGSFWPVDLPDLPAAGRPLREPKREEFAQALAKGQSIRASERAAGISHPTAMRWSRRADPIGQEVWARVEEIQRRALGRAAPTADEVLIKLIRTCDEAAAGDHHKAAIDGYKFLYSLLRENERHSLAEQSDTPHEVRDAHAFLRAVHGDE